MILNSGLNIRVILRDLKNANYLLKIWIWVTRGGAEVCFLKSLPGDLVEDDQALVAQAGPERMTLLFPPPSAGITGMNQHTELKILQLLLQAAGLVLVLYPSWILLTILPSLECGYLKGNNSQESAL